MRVRFEIKYRGPRLFFRFNLLADHHFGVRNWIKVVGYLIIYVVGGLSWWFV